MVYHTQAVCNGVEKTMVVADMPFMTYNISIEDSLKMQLSYTCWRYGSKM